MKSQHWVWNCLWGPALGLLDQGKISGSCVCLASHRPVSPVLLQLDFCLSRVGRATRGPVPSVGPVALEPFSHSQESHLPGPEGQGLGVEPNQ